MMLMERHMTEGTLANDCGVGYGCTAGGCDWMGCAIMTEIEMEDQILRTAVFELLDHGFALTVDVWSHDNYVLDRCTHGEDVLAKLGTYEDERLLARRGDKIIGWLHFIYGSNGYDVLVDWTGSLTDYIPETLALIETFKEQFA